MGCDRGAQAGVSMLEMLLVAAVLGVGVLGLLALLTGTVRAAGSSWARLTALTLANNALEETLGEAQAQAPGVSPWEGAWERTCALDGVPSGAAPPFFTVRVRPLPPDGEGLGLIPLRVVQAQVTWREGVPPLPRTVTLARGLPCW